MNTNKKSVILLSLIITAALLTSCGKEDNNKKAPAIEGIVTDTYQAPSSEDKSTDTYNSSDRPIINSASDKPVINNTAVKDSYTEYIVKKSDTLYSICKTYEKTCPIPVAVKTMLNINNLTEADGLKEGMTLKIPSDYFNHGKIYTIKKGDTLYSISREILQNQSPAASAYKIAKDNFLTNLEEINIGDQLFIAYK
jgi:LysM repeat protein